MQSTLSGQLAQNLHTALPAGHPKSDVRSCVLPVPGLASQILLHTACHLMVV